MSNLTKFVMALVSLVAMLVGASRQLFLFVTRESAGLSIVEGRSHLWLAATAGIIASVAGGLMFYFFGRHENSKWSKVVMTPTGPLLTSSSLAIRPATSRALVPFDFKRWALANPWLIRQSDDRTPMADQSETAVKRLQGSDRLPGELIS